MNEGVEVMGICREIGNFGEYGDCGDSARVQWSLKKLKLDFIDF